MIELESHHCTYFSETVTHVKLIRGGSSEVEPLLDQEAKPLVSMRTWENQCVMII